MKLDYYKLLEVDPGASLAEIKKAYRTLAKKYHPDINPGSTSSEERFKIITEAYKILTDNEKRAQYDTIVSEFKAGTAPTAKMPEDFFIPVDEDLADFLKGFYIHHESEIKKARKGEDVRCNLKVTFKEAALGTEKEIFIPCTTECQQCGGTGVKAGSKIIRCSGCRGKGKVKNSRGLYEVCERCGGSGAKKTGLCTKCSGTGVVQSRRSIRVHVPPGIETGTRLKVKGMGMSGNCGGDPGDFFVVINIKKHDFFVREGLHICCTVPVPFLKALLGCSIEIPTLDGKKTIKVPSGTQTSKVIRIRRLGIVSTEKKRRGDLLVRVNVEMPVKLSREEKKMIKQMEKNINIKAYPETIKYRRKLETI